MKNKKSYSVLIVLLVVTGIALAMWNQFKSVDVESFVAESLSVPVVRDEVVDETTTIYVHVSGEVKKPGVYALPVGSRVYEAVDMAGGVTTSAAIQAVNQAEVLEDGRQIHFPVITTSNDGDSGLVNINTATIEQLQSVAGIGPSKADSIVKYRDKNGSFKTIEDIMLVDGIKEGLFSKIEDSITVF